MGRGEKRREERKRGRERKKEREGGSLREERRKKHLSLKYMKHKNVKSLSNEVQLSLYSRCHYLVLSLNSSSSALYNDK